MQTDTERLSRVDWLERAAMAAYALEELRKELSAVPTPQNLRLLQIVECGLADLRDE